MRNRYTFAIAIASVLMLTGIHPVFGQKSTPAKSTPASSQKVFRAGAATSNITPKLGRLIVGNFNYPVARHVHDEMHARCLVLDDGTTKIGIVVCDSLGIGRAVYDQARRIITKETGIPGENILMSATHSHSGASWDGQNDGDTEYPNFLARRIADGIARANHNLEPAKIGWGIGQLPGQVFNRRWKMKPGPDLANPFGGMDQVRMNPPRQSPNLIEPAGPTDPAVSFISVQSKTGRPIALVANYSLHYVGGVPSGEISADYFAVFSDRIQELLGADRLDPPFVGMMGNGTSGDINNINFAAKGEPRKPYEQMRIVADDVAQEVIRAHKSVQFHEWVPLSAEASELKLVNRRPTAEQMEWVKATLAKPESAPQYHRLEKNYAARVQKLADRPESFDVLIQTLRIGNLGVAGIPYEVFAEIGLEIKAKSPLKPTFVFSLANGYDGYLPTPRQHKLGGYETWLSTNRVEVHASDKIIERVLSQFGSLAKKPTDSQK